MVAREPLPTPEVRKVESDLWRASLLYGRREVPFGYFGERDDAERVLSAALRHSGRG